MPKNIIAHGAFATAMALLGTLASAVANIDLTDFNDDVMRNIVAVPGRSLVSH